MEICAYLTFNGNCREAMTFYQLCLEGELNFQTVGESPMAEKMPRQMKETILQATLVKDNLKIFASDMISNKGLNKGNNISLMVNCTDEFQLKKLYENLSKGGEKTHLLESTFFGSIMGDLIDKYGVNWLLHYKI